MKNKIMEYSAFKSLLFKVDPERAHGLTKRLMRTELFIDASEVVFGKLVYENKCLEQKVFGNTFKNPVGLAAGFDKNAELIDAIDRFGFGYTEVGTVTAKPQGGNKKPRLFRLIEEESLINSLGFNNPGIEVFLRNIKKSKRKLPFGVSIGKGSGTDLHNAIDDYKKLIAAMEGLPSYVVANLSSPNTKGLRELQNEAFVEQLFSEGTRLTEKPLLLKIDPDMKPEEALKICTKAIENGAKGIIATNTSTDYTLIGNRRKNGGISGKLIMEKSRSMLDTIADEFFGDTVIISVGGISNAEDAYYRITHGATLLQLYTALIYEGPTVAGNINRGISELLRKDGYSKISDAIGANLKK